jgi:16S rRNA (adenine1518-N6/adenine1519-N6)-dimethyltransferase
LWGFSYPKAFLENACPVLTFATMQYTLKKSLGQHFLHDENICRKIVASITKTEGMKLLEVGPGGGALSKYLMSEEGIDYKAIEIDDEKVQYLLRQYPVMADKIIHSDILKASQPFDTHFSVVGNFPYNISSPIMFKMLEWEEQVDEVIGMFQKEVAQRIAEKPGSKLYGILSVLTQAFFKVTYLFDVHENCFTPPPKVKSGVVRFTNIRNPHQIANKKKFIQLVKAAFNQRRKTLRNAWKGTLMPEMLSQEIMNKRAEQLSVEDFVNIYRQWNP